MTKNELAREVAASEEILVPTAAKAVNGIIRVIKETLAKGEPLYIRGFGSFLPVECSERPGRNVNTGETVVIPARKSAKFRISKEFVSMINNEGKEVAV